MIPFGRCVLLWRLNQGLSQAALAQKAGLPRPNLSDIERGKREVSLRTLRALADALEIRPGILADGLGPGEDQGTGALGREGMEGIAESLSEGHRSPRPEHRALAEKAALLGTARRRAAAGRKGRRLPGRRVERAWLALRASRPSQEIHTLLDRISEKQRMRHRP